MKRGLARLKAERLGLRMQTGDCLGGPARRCRHVAAEPAAGTSRSAPSIARRMAGLIFADLTSFRRPREPIFPRYYRDIMQTLAKLLDRHAPHVLVRKTWGDALHVVTDDAASAAPIVREIHHTLEQIGRTHVRT